MTTESHRETLRSIAKFRVTKFQYVLITIAILAILSLGYNSILQSSTSVEQAKILSDVESPAASIIFTQRETLVYATRLAQWSNGGTTRRSVQIARNILAQRLAVIDTSGRSMGSRAHPSYWKALRDSDAIVAAAPVGVLPESVHMQFSAKISPIINQILSESRQLVVSYQRSIDKAMIDSAKKAADRTRLNLIFFYTALIASSLFLFLNVRINFRSYREARIALDAEQVRLDNTIKELKDAQFTVAQLQDLNEAKNSFISTVNHELRTPLTSIIGYIDVIREEELLKESPDSQKYLEVLDRNAQILLHLVESMLSLSKIDAARGILSEDKISLTPIIDNAIFVMQPALEKGKHKIDLQVKDDFIVQGDAGQLNQVFINLLGNAIKFSPEESTIQISLDRATSKSGREVVEIRISDHGIGIPEGDIANLFTRFFRARNAVSSQYPGTGLGLAIVHQVVEQHGGTIRVESQVNAGTTFIIQMPLFLDGEDRMILDRRGAVLRRAIDSLEGSNAETIKGIAHEMGGAIGFYGFVEEGRQLVEFSRSLSDKSNEKIEINAEKARLLALLNTAEQKIASSENG
jgi:signal transduction histidine kinase